MSENGAIPWGLGEIQDDTIRVHKFEFSDLHNIVYCTVTHTSSLQDHVPNVVLNMNMFVKLYDGLEVFEQIATAFACTSWQC